MDNLGILVQAILSLKDTTSSKNQIAKELPKLESQLQSDKNTRVKIVAGLDVAKSKNLIQSQLNTLANQAKAPAIKIGIDTSGLNSVQGATQNITNDLKNVQIQAQQTASAVKDIGNVGISDNVFKKLLQDMQISKSVTNEYKQSLRALANELTTAWDTRNEELYLAKLKEIINVIGNGQKSFKLFDKNSFDFKEITSQITALKSAIGVGIDGNGRKNKFFIDNNLKKELAYIQGSDKAVRSLLNSLYGLGNWTFDERKFGFSNLRSQIDKASASADSLYTKFSNANFGGGNIANFITEIAGQIDTLKAKLNTKDTFNGFLQLEMGIANADKQLEIMIADALKLKDFTSRRNDPLCWFEEIQTETQSLKEETAVIKEQTKATQELKAIRDSITRDANGNQIGRTTVVGNTGFTITNRYNEKNELTSYTETENYKKLEQESAKIEEIRAKYNRLLADFKSSNSAIQSGLIQPIQQFETVLSGLGKTSSINDVKNAFESLKQSASEITTYLDTTNSSFNKATNAVNNYKNMDNILKEMTASFNNLVMKPENLRTELDGVKTKLIELQNIEKTEGGYTKAWAEKYREVNLELAQVKTNIELALKAEGSSQKADKNSAYQTQLKYLNKIKEETNTIISLKRKMVNAGDEEKALYQHEITNAQKRIQYDIQQLEKKKLLTNEAKYLVNTYKEEIALQDRINNAKLNDKASTQRITDIKSYNAEIDKAITKLNSLNNSGTFRNNASNPAVTRTKQEINSLITAYQNLATKLQGNITPAGLETIRTELTQLNARFNDATTTAKRFETELRNDNGAEQLAQKVALLTSRIKAYRQANSKSEKLFGGQYDSMLSQLANPNIDLNAYNALNKQFQKMRQEINAANVAGKNLWQTFKEKLGKFTGWMSMTYAVSMFTRSIRQAVTELKEIDTILTEISKTSDRTEASLRKLGETSFATASKYGQKASDYLLGVQEMSRAGFDENSSEQMAELSTLAQSAGDMTAELANEYLIATNAGYKFGGSAEKLNAVLNSQNYITNRNALNMSELAEATKIVASQASQSGIGIDKMTAAVGTMIATTQQGGEVAARAFKGILMNLQQVKGTAEDIGDGGEDITTESLTKYEKACADLGVSLKEVKDGVLQLRDPMVILEELANAVSKEAEGSIKVANLINAVGGKFCLVT